jgi:hypothetical protein
MAEGDGIMMVCVESKTNDGASISDINQAFPECIPLISS